MHPNEARQTGVAERLRGSHYFSTAQGRIPSPRRSARKSARLLSAQTNVRLNDAVTTGSSMNIKNSFNHSRGARRNLSYMKRTIGVQSSSNFESAKITQASKEYQTIQAESIPGSVLDERNRM